MPKIKTHSGAKKRFKLSKNGKVIRAHANKSPHSEQEDHQAQERPAQERPWPTRPMWRQVKRLIPYK